MATFIDIGAEQTTPGLDIGGEQTLGIVQLVGVSGIPTSVAFGSGGAVLAPPFLDGVAGIPSSVAFGVGGKLVVQIQGVAGIPTSVAFGVGGSVTPALIGVAGIPSSVAFGVGGKALFGLSGTAGITTSVAFGVTGAILTTPPPGAPLITVFINGVDKTAYVAPATNSSAPSGGGTLKRTWQVGSSGSNCTIPMNNAQGLTAYRPAKQDAVIIFEGTERWFDGYVDQVAEVVEPGQNWVQLTVTAVTWGALLDRRYIGRHYIRPYAFLANIVLYDMITKYFGDHLNWGASSGDPGTNIGEPVFNWVTGNQALAQICAMNAWNYLVNMARSVVAFPIGTGTGPAPFTLTNSKFIALTSTKDFSQFANSVLVRNNNLTLQPLWTDTNSTLFPTPDGITKMFATSSDLLAKPIIKVNGVTQIVTDPGVYGKPWDWQWFPYTVVQNFLSPAVGPGDTLEVTYASPLSYVQRSQDLTDIATRGLYEHLEEVQDVVVLEVLKQIADGLLVKTEQDVTEIQFVTDERGLAPGQLLTVSTTLPPLDDKFLIEKIESVLLPNERFRHTVTASNATLDRGKSGVYFFQQVLAMAKQPKSLNKYPIGWTLAETIPGFTNPGLLVGSEHPTILAPASGVARDCVISFRNMATITTTVDIEIDIFQNGTSIFPSGSTNKMVFPAGAQQSQTQLIFATNPFYVTQNDVFTMEVVTADSLAMDGSVVLTVMG